MSYLTLREAAEATGLNEATIRRLCKKVASKPFVRMKEGKQGGMYTIQANYLFDTYPPLRSGKNAFHTRLDNDSTGVDKEPIQDYTALLAAKDDIIQILKNETAYLQAENTSLREENRALKLLSPPGPVSSIASTGESVDSVQKQGKRSIWQRLFS